MVRLFVDGLEAKVSKQFSFDHMTINQEITWRILQQVVHWK